MTYFNIIIYISLYQIIHIASDESGIDVNLFGKIEAGDKIKSSLFGNKSSIYKGDLVLPGNKDFISDENLFNYQAKVVNDLAEKESYVITTPDFCCCNLFIIVLYE